VVSFLLIKCGLGPVLKCGCKASQSPLFTHLTASLSHKSSNLDRCCVNIHLIAWSTSVIVAPTSVLTFSRA